MEVRQDELERKLIAVICWIIRQLWFNPFAPLGDSAIVLNLIFGGAFSVVTYLLVGLVYNGESTTGSITYMILYAINTAATYVGCLVYPSTILIAIVVIGYVVILSGTLKWIAGRN